MEMDSFSPVLHPVIVQGDWQSKISQISCGKTHMVALCETGEMYSWGDNRCAQLGIVLSKPIFPSSSPSSSSSSSGIHGSRTVGRGSSAHYRKSGPGSGMSSGSGMISGSFQGEGESINPLNHSSSSPPVVYMDRGDIDMTDTMAAFHSRSGGTALLSMQSSGQLPNSITSDLGTVMACRPVLIECMKAVKITSVVCGAYHSLCLSDEGLVFSWGRASNGRLGQLPDRASTPDNAVGRPALVRCNWVVKEFDLFPSSPSLNAYKAMTLEEELAVTLEDFYSFTTQSQSQSQSQSQRDGVDRDSTVYDMDTGQGKQSRYDNEGPQIQQQQQQQRSPYTHPHRNPLEASVEGGGARGSGSERSLSQPYHATADSISGQNVRTKYVQRIQHTPDEENSIPPTPCPSSPSSLHRVVCIAAGFSHSIAVTAGGGVFTWGCGTHGRLGHGSHSDEFLPRQVTHVFYTHTCTLVHTCTHTQILSKTADNRLRKCKEIHRC